MKLDDSPYIEIGDDFHGKFSVEPADLRCRCKKMNDDEGGRMNKNAVIIVAMTSRIYLPIGFVPSLLRHK